MSASGEGQSRRSGPFAENSAAQSTEWAARSEVLAQLVAARRICDRIQRAGAAQAMTSEMLGLIGECERAALQGRGYFLTFKREKGARFLELSSAIALETKQPMLSGHALRDAAVRELGDEKAKALLKAKEDVFS